MDLMSFVQSRNPNKKVVKVEMIPGSRAYRVYFEGGGIGFGGLPSEASDQNDYGSLREYLNDVEPVDASVVTEEEMNPMLNKYKRILEGME